MTKSAFEYQLYLKQKIQQFLKQLPTGDKSHRIKIKPSYLPTKTTIPKDNSPLGQLHTSTTTNTVLGQLPMRTILHQIKIKPNHCPPGPQSLGLFPTRTTPHQDHYHKIKPLIRTNTCTVGNCPGGELSRYRSNYQMLPWIKNCKHVLFQLSF